jgi:hypothetical protein
VRPLFFESDLAATQQAIAGRMRKAKGVEAIEALRKEVKGLEGRAFTSWEFSVSWVEDGWLTVYPPGDRGDGDKITLDLTFRDRRPPPITPHPSSP